MKLPNIISKILVIYAKFILGILILFTIYIISAITIAIYYDINMIQSTLCILSFVISCIATILNGILFMIAWFKYIPILNIVFDIIAAIFMIVITGMYSMMDILYMIAAQLRI